MVTNMAETINRVGTPMRYYEEDLLLPRKQLEAKKKRLTDKQRAKSPFLVGSIEEVNKKVSRLDRRLQHYTSLIIESRSSTHDDEYQIYMPPSSAEGRERVKKKETERKEMDRFAGVVAVQSTIAPNVSHRVKNISKISMQEQKKPLASKKDREKTTTSKPRFVELHNFPGYDSTELTPLPHNVTALEILEKATDAQLDLHKKPQYKPHFQKLLYSQMSQGILLDVFWWYFLDRYQKNTQVQEKLFNRIAHNFVKLLTYNRHPYYKDTFLKDYPNILAQAVYAAFCEVFPDSYRQFNDDFREGLTVLVIEWCTGVKPAPRLSHKWNFDKLEPPGIRAKADMMENSNEKKRKEKANNVQFAELIESLASDRNTETGSTISINQSVSQVSVSSSRTGRAATRRKDKIRRDRFTSPDGSVSEDKSINDVFEAQQPVRTGSRIVPKKTTYRPIPQDMGHLKGLTPISEERFPSGSKLNRGKNLKEVQPKSVVMPLSTERPMMRTKPVESHPACKGPDFVRTAFNVFGRSPLVAHFLRMKNIHSAELATSLKVERTEMENLPPVDAVTYRDVIKQSYKTVKDLNRKYQELYRQNERECTKFVLDQIQELKEHKAREVKLLANKQEVKIISDLLLIERKISRELEVKEYVRSLTTDMAAVLKL